MDVPLCAAAAAAAEMASPFSSRRSRVSLIAHSRSLAHLMPSFTLAAFSRFRALRNLGSFETSALVFCNTIAMRYSELGVFIEKAEMWRHCPQLLPHTRLNRPRQGAMLAEITTSAATECTHYRLQYAYAGGRQCSERETGPARGSFSL